MNILFICRYNRFRSRVAEALFNHYNKDKSIIAKSAGIELDPVKGFIISRAARILDAMHVPYEDKTAELVNESAIKWADKIIVVADDIPVGIFPPEKTLQIDIPDEHFSDDEAKNTVAKIDKYIRGLVKNLKGNKSR